MLNLSVMKNMMEPGKKSRIGNQGTINVLADDAHDVTALYERLSVDDEQEGESNSITNQDGICQGGSLQKLQIIQ